MSYLYFSESESRSCGLRIGRSEVIRDLDPEVLAQEIAGLELDVCRIKIDMDDTGLYRKLDSLRMPLEYYSILVRQFIELNETHIRHVPELRFELYHAGQSEVLRNILADILGANTATYYDNSLYAALFDAAGLQEGFIRYYLGFDHDQNPDKYLYIAYEGDVPVGFVCTDVYGDHAEPVMFGITQAFRSRNYAIEIVRFAQHSAATRLGCRTLSTNTVILNARSLNTTLLTGMKITGTIANIILYPLLHMGGQNPVTRQVSPKDLVPVLLGQAREAGAGPGLNLSHVLSNLPADGAESEYALTVPLCRPGLVVAQARRTSGSGHMYLLLDQRS